MKTQEMLTLLSENHGKELKFEYQPGKWVPASYHITEVKNVRIDSVDCGGNGHYEELTVVQLWASENEKKDRGLATEKAHSIFNRVDGIKPLNPDAEIRFEYGNDSHPTSLFRISSLSKSRDSLTLKLHVPPTACKPRLVWEGLKNAVAAPVESCCGPGTGCC